MDMGHRPVDCWLLLRPTNRHRETETSFWFSFKWKYWLSLARPGTGPPPLTARSSGSNLWQFEFHQKQMLELFSSISFSKHCLLIHHRSIFISNPLQKIHACQNTPHCPQRHGSSSASLKDCLMRGDRTHSAARNFLFGKKKWWFIFRTRVPGHWTFIETRTRKQNGEERNAFELQAPFFFLMINTPSFCWRSSPLLPSRDNFPCLINGAHWLTSGPGTWDMRQTPVTNWLLSVLPLSPPDGHHNQSRPAHSWMGSADT